VAELRAGRLAEVTVTDTELRGRLTEPAAAAAGVTHVVARRLRGLDDATLVDEVRAHAVKVSARRAGAVAWILAAAASLLPVAVLWLLLGHATRRAAGEVDRPQDVVSGPERPGRRRRRPRPAPGGTAFPRPPTS
jgi:hypothetical protein